MQPIRGLQSLEDTYGGRKKQLVRSPELNAHHIRVRRMNEREGGGRGTSERLFPRERTNVAIHGRFVVTCDLLV